MVVPMMSMTRKRAGVAVPVTYFVCGAHADAVGVIIARQALENALAGLIGSLARDRGITGSSSTF